MIAEWQINDLIALVRRRYPDWDGFEHPPFVADEIEYKRATIQKARQLLGKAELKRLLETAAYDDFIARLETIGRDNSLLWNNVPRRGDLAILYVPHLKKWDFCEQMRALLYAQRPSPDRLEEFAGYCEQNQLPNKWTFATYFLFITRPHAEMFIKPSIARWFLRFMGIGDLYTPTPNAETYEWYKKNCHGLKAELAGYGAQDMVDVQGLIWVAARESQKRTEGLTLVDQINFDVPGEAASESLTENGDEEALAATPAEEEALEPAELEGAVRVRETPEQPYAAQTENPEYPLAQCAAETGVDAAALARWVSAIERKRQAIFYGPPGTGKTFLAQKLAQHLAGGSDGFVDLVQFHPAYEYADFVEGIRPQTDAAGNLRYELVNGRFLDFCAQAAQRNGRCVLIIDEINRANLARVFGELLYLLEYRDQAMKLASGTNLRIPENVRLLGTMNTADRSIALVDNALRRRFAFIHLQPDYDVLRHYHAQRTGLNVEDLIQLLERLNGRIGDPNYAVGITFFLRPDLERTLGDIWRMEIEPYLEELFFDQPDEIEPFRWEQIQPQIRLLKDEG